ncbi:sec-independent protein translocase protein TatA [Balneicella halophila]|uniref:Sec-independent protein translocase protein TatA n=1 Tax=Balneicella halophila TaxID=1537566 RepID=A0A7L4UNI1_BALHA|nr:twin-arginine translocase TatA/TatE family subunit [Balneicella halophila]PVX50743.1 sec-independent protein translocase protein TatA [Balneicella halophila]
MILLFGIGGFEILLIFLVALLLFGSKQLPEIARTLGKGWGEIKRTTSELREEFKNQANAVEKESKNITDELNKTEKES